MSKVVSAILVISCVTVTGPLSIVKNINAKIDVDIITDMTLISNPKDSQYVQG